MLCYASPYTSVSLETCKTAKLFEGLSEWAIWAIERSNKWASEPVYKWASLQVSQSASEPVCKSALSCSLSKTLTLCLSRKRNWQTRQVTDWEFKTQNWGEIRYTFDKKFGKYLWGKEVKHWNNWILNGKQTVNRIGGSRVKDNATVLRSAVQCHSDTVDAHHAYVMMVVMVVMMVHGVVVVMHVMVAVGGLVPTLVNDIN